MKVREWSDARGGMHGASFASAVGGFTKDDWLPSKKLSPEAPTPDIQHNK